MIYKIVFFTTIFVLSILFSNGQILNIGIQKTFGGSFNDILQKSISTNDGGIICIGQSSSSVSGDKNENSYGFNDYWVVKFDQNLNLVWQKTIGGNQGENGLAIAETPGGNFIIGGGSVSGISGLKTTPNLGNDDYWIVKLSSTGNFLWDASFGGAGTDILATIQIDSLGFIYLGGQSNSDTSGTKSEFSKGSSDYWILKLDSLGNKIWDKTIGGSNSDVLKDFVLKDNGESVIYGISVSNISGDKTQNSFNNSSDLWVVKVSNTGAIIWDKTIGGNDIEINGFSIVFKEGYYYMVCPSLSGATGMKTEPSQGIFDTWVVKIDENGNKIWDKSIGGSGSDFGYSLFITSNNQILVFSASDSNISGNKTENCKGGSDGWIVAIDTSSNILWQKTIGGSNNEVFLGGIEISDGYYQFAGYSDSNISGDKTENSRGLEDYWLVELDTDLGIGDINTEEFISIFPNPARDLMNIHFKNTSENNKIEIFNSIGQLVYSSITNINYSIDISTWNNGIYFLLSGGIAKKIIVSK